MQIAIDYITKLDRRLEQYRKNITVELSQRKDLDVVVLHQSHRIDLKADVQYIKVRRSIFPTKNAQIYKHLKATKADVYFTFSLSSSTVTSKVLTYLYLENLISNYNEKTIARSQRRIIKKLDKYAAIIVTTNYFKVFLSNHYKVDKSKILTTYEAIESNFAYENINADERAVRQILSIYRVSKPYILVYGKLKGESHVLEVVDSFAELFQKYPQYKLLISSEDFKVGWDNKAQPLNKKAAELLELVTSKKLNRNVVFSEKIDRKHLPLIIKSAHISINLFEYKKFPASLLEELSAGVAMIVSDNPVSKEIVDQAARVVNPKLKSNITNEIAYILEDREMRLDLIRKAIARSKEFSWEESANTIYLQIRKDLSNRPKPKFAAIINSTRSRHGLISILSRYFDLSVYSNTKWANDLNLEIKQLQKPIPRRLVQYFRILKNNDYCLIYNDNKTHFNLLLLVAKILTSHKKLILNFDHAGILNQDNTSRFRQIISDISHFWQGIFIKCTFQMILVQNPLLARILGKRYHIKSKAFQFVPKIIDSQKSQKQASRKDHLAIIGSFIGVNLEFEKEQKGLVCEIIKETFSTSKYKFVLQDQDQYNNLVNTIDKKYEKRIVYLDKTKDIDPFSICKIFLNLKHDIDIRYIYKAFAHKCLVMAVENIDTKYLIKPGINGYIYEKNEMHRIAKQLNKLYDKKVHIKDIGNINSKRAMDFEIEEVSKEVERLIKQL